MKINKKLQIKNFSTFAKTYNEWAKPQLESAKYLSNLINENSMQNDILDAGCGTGLLTSLLIKKFPKCKITGLDLSKDIEKYYIKENKNYFINADLEKLNLKNESFNHIVSNFALHWTDLKLSINNLCKISKFYLSLGIPVEGSLKYYLSSKKLPNFPFPKVINIVNLLEKKGFKINHKELKIINIPYQGINLLKYFRYTGTKFLPSTVVIKSIKQWLKYELNKKYYYKVLFVLCTKNK